VKTVSVYRAQPVASDAVPQATIVIDDEIPPVTGVEGAQRVFEEQGAALAAALWESLPGGTIDALLREMLLRRASLLRVSFGGGS